MDNRRLAAGIVLAVAVPFSVAQEKPPDLPEGKDKATLVRVCTTCHELDAVLASRRTLIGWQQNVEDMVSRGAEGSEADMSAIAAYLTKNFGKLNVNTATAEQMQAMLAFTDKEAQALVTYRDKNGKVKDFEQLKSVPGMSADKLTEKRPLIAFTQ